jgi:hypothetical protein
MLLFSEIIGPLSSAGLHEEDGIMTPNLIGFVIDSNNRHKTDMSPISK